MLFFFVPQYKLLSKPQALQWDRADAYCGASVVPTGSGSDPCWSLVRPWCPPSSTALSEPETAPDKNTSLQKQDWMICRETLGERSNSWTSNYFEILTSNCYKGWDRFCIHMLTRLNIWIKKYPLCGVQIPVALQSYRCAAGVNG